MPVSHAKDKTSRRRAIAQPSSRRLEIYRALSAVIDPEDRWLVVHSSLPSLRLDPAGLKWDLLAALAMLLREGRTIALPTFTFGFCHGQAYDHRHSPGETGQLGNWFLDLNDARRTKAPIYSFAVAGPGMDELLAAANSTTFGDDSSFALFERHHARIAMLGCEWTACTQFHRYEEAAQVPYRRYKDFAGMADYGKGPVARTARMYVRDEQIGAINNFRLAIERLRSAGEIREAELGEGRIESVNCAALADVCRKLLAGDPWVFAMRPGTPNVCRERPPWRSADQEPPSIRSSRNATEGVPYSNHDRSSNKPPLRIALLGHSNLELIRTAMQELAAEFSADRPVEVHTVLFGQLLPQIATADSELHRFHADVALFVDRLEDLFQVPSLDDVRERADADEAIAHYLAAIEHYVARHNASVFVQRFFQSGPTAHGAFDAADEGGVAALVDRSNQRLAELLKKCPAVRLFDPAPTAAALGEGPVYDPRLWHLGRFPFSAAFSRELARRFWGLVLAALGRTARLIVLDLDGTLWGGVLGEDGIEGLQLGGDYPGNAYVDFQRALKRLSRRGVALALASKNDENDALRTVRELPNMVLRDADFVAHRINWLPKPENVVEMAAELGLALEHVLFIDDNPAEREWMRQALPAVKVIDLPDDPAMYADALLRCPYLECVELTAEDVGRSRDYRRRAADRSARVASDSEVRKRGRLRYEDKHMPNAQRVAHPSASGGHVRGDFEALLATEVLVAPLDARNAARAEQLMQKTNQFNTTSRRYRRGRLAQLQSEGHGVYVIAARDRFREQDNIGVLVVRWSQPETGSAELDSLLLSCRVLGRGIETAVLAWLCREAASRSIERLIAPIVIAERNEPVRDVYQRHGFEPTGEPNVWQLELARGGVSPPAGITILDDCPAAA